MTTLILLILAVIIGSGLFSGMEAALFAVPQSRVMMLAEQKKGGSTALLKIKENLSRAIIVIVIGNNKGNIILKKTCKGFAPSTYAASSNSRGIDVIN